MAGAPVTSGVSWKENPEEVSEYPLELSEEVVVSGLGAPLENRPDTVVEA